MICSATKMQPLCDSFIIIGDYIWHSIRAAQNIGIRFYEDTITELALLYVGVNHPTSVRIRSFTRRREAKTGADWEWWIGRPGSWLGMRVQAKRMSYPKHNFGSLLTYTPYGSRIRQIDALIRKAHLDALNPAYVFYVSSRTRHPLWLEKIWRRCPCALYPGYPGSLISDACAVRKVNSNRLTDLAEICLPWQCIVCDCLVCPSPSARLAERAFSALKRSRSELERLDQPIMDEPWYPPRENLPDYLLALERSEEYDMEADETLRERAGERGLAGFVVLRED